MDILKDWGFAILTAGLLYVILRRVLNSWAQEAAVRQTAEERYRALFDRSLDCVFLNDFAGKFLDANPAALDLLGYQREEIAALTFASLLSEDQLPAAFQAVEEIRATGSQKQRREFKLRCKDGREVFVEVQSSLLSRDGKPFAIQGIARDITLRKLAERQMVQANTYVNTLLAASPIGIITYRADGQAVSANEAAAKLVGTTLENVKRQNFRELESWKKTDFLRLADQALATGEARLFENYTVSSHGAANWLSCRFVPFRHQGNPHLLLMVQDISALKQQTALLEALVNSAKDGILVVDSQSRKVFQNQKVADLWKIPAEIANGLDDARQHKFAREQTKDPAAFDETTRRLVASPDEFAGDEIELKDGTVLERRTSLVKDAEGRSYGRVWWFRDITARRQAEAARRQSEELLRTVMDLVPVFIFAKDGQSRHLFVNRTCAAASGLTVEQMTGKCDLDFIADRALAEAFMQDDREVIETGRPKYVAEETFVNAAGQTRILQTTKIPFAFPGGGPALLGVAVDITESKQAETALKQERNLLRTLVDHLPDMVYVRDLGDRFLFANESFARRMGGASEADLVGKSDADFYPPEVAACFAENDRKVFAGGEIIGHECTVTFPNGETLAIVSTKVPLKNAEGKVTGLIGVIHDITEQKRAETVLRESEARYRQLFELESDAIVLVDSETHRYVDVNPATQRLYGYSREEFLQMTPEAVSCEPDKTRDHIDHCDVAVPLRWHRKKNGERFAVEIMANQIMHQGRPTALVALRDVTARQQIIDMLRETSAQLLEAQRIANLGSYVFDARTGTWTSSAVLDEVFGIADPGFARDVAGWLQLIHPEDRPEMQRHLTEEVLKNHAPFDHIYRIVRLNDHQERWVHGLGKLVLDADGEVRQMVGVIQDITERRLAQANLRESEEKYRSLFESSFDAIATVDPATGKFTTANPAALKLFGAANEGEFVGHGPEDYSPERQPDGRLSAEKARAMDVTALREGSALFDWTHRRQDGGEFWADVLLTRIERKGRTENMATIRDITERKRAEEQMRLQFTALTSAANAIVITDRQGKIEWVNPSFTRMTGYTAEEAVGGNPRVLKSGEHPPAYYANLWATVCTGNAWHGEIINKRKDGTLYTEEMTITPVRGADGEIAHFVAIKQDVTERRRLEDHLRQSQKMEAIGTLAGGIAHDFNNMLGAMFGFGYLLQQDTQDNPAAQESVEEILKAATRAKELVQQILTFSRQREHKRQIIRLDTVVKEAMKFLRASLPADITTEIKIAPDAPAVLADATQIYQVTMNLATNALHAMEDRTGKITVALDSIQPDEKLRQAHPELQAIPYTRLTVADTGHGMDAKTLARIFEPFFTTKPAGKGTGLGLAVVHGIVKSHDGVITVESEPGQGTTFRIYFPAQNLQAALTDAAAEKNIHGRGQKILLVDDEPALTASLSRLLERQNYQVVTHNHAAEAVALFRENPAWFDLVITDLSMPGMNGLEVARQIHALRPEMPVIVMSGFASELNRENLRATGVGELLDKPVSPSALTEVLQRLFAKA